MKYLFTRFCMSFLIFGVFMIGMQALAEENFESKIEALKNRAVELKANGKHEDAQRLMANIEKMKKGQTQALRVRQRLAAMKGIHPGMAIDHLKRAITILKGSGHEQLANYLTEKTHEIVRELGDLPKRDKEHSEKAKGDQPQRGFQYMFREHAEKHEGKESPEEAFQRDRERKREHVEEREERRERMRDREQTKEREERHERIRESEHAKESKCEGCEKHCEQMKQHAREQSRDRKHAEERERSERRARMEQREHEREREHAEARERVERRLRDQQRKAVEQRARTEELREQRRRESAERREQQRAERFEQFQHRKESGRPFMEEWHPPVNQFRKYVGHLRDQMVEMKKNPPINQKVREAIGNLSEQMRHLKEEMKRMREHLEHMGERR